MRSSIWRNSCFNDAAWIRMYSGLLIQSVAGGVLAPAPSLTDPPPCHLRSDYPYRSCTKVFLFAY